MNLGFVARLTAVLAIVQMLLAIGVWWLVTGSPPAGAGRRPPSSSMATQRLAELYANAAFRAVITSDYAALNELIRQSSAWPEVAYVSVEDAKGRILAHTDPSKVGQVWDDRFAAELLAMVKVPYEQVAVPLTDATGSKGGSRTGQLRLGYIVSGQVPVPTPEPVGGVPLAVVLALAAIAAIPIAILVARVAGTASTAANSSITQMGAGSPASELQEAVGELLRMRTDLANRSQELAKARSEGERYVAQVEELQAELTRLRADAARLQADREEPQAADETPTDPGRDPRQLQARTIAQIAQAFRSSLTNVVGYSKLLLRGADGELSQGQKANVAVILEAGARLTALINGLSEYVRVEAGAEETTPTAIDVGPLLDEIAADSARDGRLQISAVPASEPLLVRADRRHLEHILRVLATDAMALDPKAAGLLSTMPRDGVIAFELVLAEFHAPEAQRNLWDPFGSDDLSRPLDEGHLRLAVARCLAETNGGHLHLEVRGPAEVAFVLEMQAVDGRRQP